MFSVEIDYLVRKEQYRDLQRDVVRWQLSRVATLRQSNPIQWPRRVAGWIGTQMVKIGFKLQHHGQYQQQTLTQ